MIDLNHLEKYRENNRIEAKKALGGLPKSVWETYSAFANTLGGIILLGVEEHADKTLHTVDLPEPEKLAQEFWDLVNNPNKVNVNILTQRSVRIEEVNGDHIIVIEVPRAQRYYKPVYVDGNPVTGTYRRNGEGDYHCTVEEYQAMVRDASTRSQDMLVLEEMDASVFCADSLRSYRQRMRLYRPGHVWEGLEDEDFLIRLGATAIGSDGKVHPTAAGLLMFGYEYEIVREFPAYFLDYREELDDATRWTDRVISSSGDWSGNVYDFYFRVYNKLAQGVKVPFKLEGGARIDDTPVHKALREALANCLINADYYGRQGVVIVKRPDGITLTNPGDFRIEVDAAKSGGVSDPRNVTLMKMFNLVDVGERAGSGIPSIFYVWKQQGWRRPSIAQTAEPDRVTVSLPVVITSGDNKEKAAIKSGDNGEKTAIKSGDKKAAIKSGDNVERLKLAAQKEIIVAYLTDHVQAKSTEIGALLGLKPSRVRAILKQMADEGLIETAGANRNRVYKLKA